MRLSLILIAAVALATPALADKAHKKKEANNSQQVVNEDEKKEFARSGSRAKWNRVPQSIDKQNRNVQK